MAKVQYIGNGLKSKGIAFNKSANGGVYELNKEVSEYVLANFGKDFILIEPEAKKEIEVEVKPKPRKRRKKSTDVIEE